MGLELGLGKAGEEGDGMDWEIGGMGGYFAHIHTRMSRPRMFGSGKGKGWKGQGGERRMNIPRTSLGSLTAASAGVGGSWAPVFLLLPCLSVFLYALSCTFPNWKNAASPSPSLPTAVSYLENQASCICTAHHPMLSYPIIIPSLPPLFSHPAIHRP